MYLRFKASYNKPNLDGNGSIIPSILPYQMFVSLIETCGIDSVSLFCKGFLLLSTNYLENVHAKTTNGSHESYQRGKAWFITV